MTELYGPEQARISAEDWLDELESMNRYPRIDSRMAIDHDCGSGAICESVDRGSSFAVMMQSAPHRDTRSSGLHTPKQIIVTLDPAYHQCAFIGLDLSRPYQRSATMVKDATADYPDKEMHAALDINIPNYASAVVTTNQVIEALSFHLQLTQSASNG